jgi:hypothetical protein
MFDGDDLATRFTRATDATEQRTDGAIDACGEQHGEQPARRLRPVIFWRQQHGVKSQHQVEHRHGAVQEAPGAVGKFLPQRDHQHDQHGIDGPFAHVLGQIAQDFQQAGVLLFGQAAFAADGRFDGATGQFDQPVQRGESDGENAGPFVRAVDAIHAAQRCLQPRRARGQQHHQRHQRNRQQAAQIDGFPTRNP